MGEDQADMKYVIAIGILLLSPALEFTFRVITPQIDLYASRIYLCLIADGICAFYDVLWKSRIYGIRDVIIPMSVR